MKLSAWYEMNYLAHHGIKGQKWGVQNGPPYPLDDNPAVQAKKKNEQEKTEVVTAGLFSRKIEKEEVDADGFRKPDPKRVKEILKELNKNVQYDSDWRSYTAKTRLDFGNKSLDPYGKHARVTSQEYSKKVTDVSDEEIRNNAYSFFEEAATYLASLEANREKIMRQISEDVASDIRRWEPDTNVSSDTVYKEMSMDSVGVNAEYRNATMFFDDGGLCGGHAYDVSQSIDDIKSKPKYRGLWG